MERRPMKKRLSKVAAQKRVRLEEESQLMGELLFDAIADVSAKVPAESSVISEVSPVKPVAEVPTAPQMVNLGSTIAPEASRRWAPEVVPVTVDAMVDSEPCTDEMAVSNEASAEPAVVAAAAEPVTMETPVAASPEEAPVTAAVSEAPAVTEVPAVAPAVSASPAPRKRSRLSLAYIGGTLSLLCCFGIFAVQLSSTNSTDSVEPSANELQMAPTDSVAFEESTTIPAVNPAEVFAQPAAEAVAVQATAEPEAVPFAAEAPAPVAMAAVEPSPEYASTTFGAVDEDEDFEDVPQFNAMLTAVAEPSVAVSNAPVSVPFEEEAEEYPVFNATAFNEVGSTMDEVPTFNPMIAAPAYAQPAAAIGSQVNPEPQYVPAVPVAEEFETETPMAMEMPVSAEMPVMTETPVLEETPVTTVPVPQTAPVAPSVGSEVLQSAPVPPSVAPISSTPSSSPRKLSPPPTSRKAAAAAEDMPSFDISRGMETTSCENDFSDTTADSTGDFPAVYY